MRQRERQSKARGRDRALSGVAALWGLSAAVFAAWLLHAWSCWDDAGYVHLVFARSLAGGQSFRFGGQTVYGDSSPLWVWLLAGFHIFIPDWVRAGRVLSALCGVVLLASVFEFARALTRSAGRERSRSFAAAMVLLVAANPIFGRWAFTGTAAAAAAALACLALAAAAGPLTEPTSPRRLVLGCVCAGAAPLLRPEMVLLAVLVGLVLFVRWVNAPLRFGTKLLVFFAGWLLVVAPALAWTVYAVHVFGTAIPNGFAASVAAPDESSLRELLIGYLLGFPVVFFGIPALGLAYFRWRRYTHTRSSQIPAAMDPTGLVALLWTAGLTAFYLAHHTLVESRYLLLTAPALMIVVLALAHRLWPRMYRGGLGLGLVGGVLGSAFIAWPAITAETKADRVRADLAAFLRTVPAGGRVAALKVGELEFLSARPTIDLSGLMRPGVLPFRNDVTDNRRVWWIHEQGAGYLVLDHAPEPGSTRVWSRDLPATESVMDPRHRGSFDILTLWKLPPAPTLPIAADMPLQER